VQIYRVHSKRHPLREIVLIGALLNRDWRRVKDESELSLDLINRKPSIFVLLKRFEISKICYLCSLRKALKGFFAMACARVIDVVRASALGKCLPSHHVPHKYGV